MEKNKVSFDFDSTLTKKSIQKFAKKLVEQNFDVYIITSRCFVKEGIIYNNSDLFYVAEQIGIKSENIIFTNTEFKYKYITNNFIFHIDDDKYELEKITNIPVINSTEKNCIKKCWKIINKNKG